MTEHGSRIGRPAGIAVALGIALARLLSTGPRFWCDGLFLLACYGLVLAWGIPPSRERQAGAVTAAVLLAVYIVSQAPRALSVLGLGP